MPVLVTLVDHLCANARVRVVGTSPALSAGATVAVKHTVSIQMLSTMRSGSTKLLKSIRLEFVRHSYY